ncbi:MAG: glycosyltransferase family 4 protein [Lachnospiraceae bacterium]|nr:glycosyltransferase family 4 protein [Lachnospiraceae bacterium]
MKLVFVSNYLNHHQIPMSNALFNALAGSYAFIQTEKMEEERVKLGWDDNLDYPYLVKYYEQPDKCKQLIAEADWVIFGGVEDESYIADRIAEGKKVFRYSERLYKEGQWKFVSPRGLKKKFHDHTRHFAKPVYLLCSGAYVPSDFHLVRAYRKKMYKWGYFPETKHYDVDNLIDNKKGNAEGTIQILWASRFIDWKHPETALSVAYHLKSKNVRFRMIMTGTGELLEETKKRAAKEGLSEYIEFTGALPPSQVRRLMERSDIFIHTADRKEGWGAVLNEAMNSGCVCFSDVAVGAAPYLIEDGVNGVLYRRENMEDLYEKLDKVVASRPLRSRLGKAAYRTITDKWNAEYAAKQFVRLMSGDMTFAPDGPCSKAEVISESKMRRRVRKW